MTQGEPQTPMYLTIADDLRAQIGSGRIAPHAPLPTVDELAERWSCPAAAARHAVIALRNLGLVYIEHGKGVFAAENPPRVRANWDRYRRPHTATTYEQESARARQALDVEHHGEHAEAPAEVAERLGIAEGDPVLEITYRISMGGQPVSFSICWEPLALTGGTEVEDPHQGPYAGRGITPRFEAIGYHVDAEEEILQVRLPEQHEAVQLGISGTLPVVQIWQTFWSGDIPVQVAKIIFRPDSYEFQYRTSID
jgi:GntR family transcriptional regulator